MTYVKSHVGRRLVIKLDLKDYFLSVERSRVRALFHLAGYPPAVSCLLSGICTLRFSASSLPYAVKSKWKYETFHLPQGAPTSPALADRLLFRLDMRLNGLAKHMKIPYTRYADDIAFSTDDTMMTGNRIDHFLRLVRNIIAEEGFQVNEKKTRVMPQSQRQRLVGLVVNQKTNVERSEYDRLKAIIHRCVKNGYEAENRQGHPAFAQHLQGRVEFVRMTHPKRGEKLEAMLVKVDSRVSLHSSTHAMLEASSPPPSN